MMSTELAALQLIRERSSVPARRQLTEVMALPGRGPVLG